MNLNHYDRLCVFTDVHGSFEELIRMILDNSGLGYRTRSNKLFVKDADAYVHHISGGDLIDKGDDIEKVIRFIYNNLYFISLVLGNHERYVYNYLKGKIAFSKGETTEIYKHFDTIFLLAQNDELKQMFFTIVEHSHIFVETEQFIVTHAPCKKEFLGIDNDFAIPYDPNRSSQEMKALVAAKKAAASAQVNFKYPKEDETTKIEETGEIVLKYSTHEIYREAVIESTKFLFDEADENDKFHIFGHIPSKDVFRYKNKIGLDTGCVYGNKLSTILFTKGEQGFLTRSYKSGSPVTRELFIPFFKK